MTPKQGWFESDEDYRERVAQEANERVIENSTGSVPSEGWFESTKDYRVRIAQEANERIVEDSTGSAPSEGWFESTEDYHHRIAQEANQRIVEDSTGRAPKEGWFERNADFDVRVRSEANEAIITGASRPAPRQGWFESAHEYRSRIAHEAREIRASDSTDAAAGNTGESAYDSLQSSSGTSGAGGTAFVITGVIAVIAFLFYANTRWPIGLPQEASPQPRPALTCVGISEDGTRCYSQYYGWVQYRPTTAQERSVHAPKPVRFPLSGTEQIFRNTVASTYHFGEKPQRATLPTFPAPPIDGGYTNPFEYCSVVVNRDGGEGGINDSNYTGVQPPPEVVTAVGKSIGIATFQGPVFWRCLNSKVYGCNVGASGRGCRIANNSEQQLNAIREHCAQYPNDSYVANAVNYSNSDWGCGAGIPYIVSTYPLDQAGYLKEAWIRVEPDSMAARTSPGSASADLAVAAQNTASIEASSSEADKRLAVDRLIESNQHSHSVPHILSTNTFELVGKLEDVSTPRGSGGFWGFALKSVGDNDEYAFGCSSQSEIYIRIHDKDASLLDGIKALKKGVLVRLYIRDRDQDFLQQCSRGSRCDGAICPIGIEFNLDE